MHLPKKTYSHLLSFEANTTFNINMLIKLIFEGGVELTGWFLRFTVYTLVVYCCVHLVRNEIILLKKNTKIYNTHAFSGFSLQISII